MKAEDEVGTMQPEHALWISVWIVAVIVKDFDSHTRTNHPRHTRIYSVRE